MVSYGAAPFRVQILVRGRNVEVTKTLRTHVERSVGTSLGRFGDRIGGVVVRFSDPRGPTAGDGQLCCEIQVSLRRSVRERGTDSNLLSAVEQVSARVARSVARVIARERELDPSVVDATDRSRRAP